MLKAFLTITIVLNWGNLTNGRTFSRSPTQDELSQAQAILTRQGFSLKNLQIISVSRAEDQHPLTLVVGSYQDGHFFAALHIPQESVSTYREHFLQKGETQEGFISRAEQLAKDYSNKSYSLLPRWRGGGLITTAKLAQCTIDLMQTNGPSWMLLSFWEESDELLVTVYFDEVKDGYFSVTYSTVLTKAKSWCVADWGETQNSIASAEDDFWRKYLGPFGFKLIKFENVFGDGEKAKRLKAEIISKVIAKANELYPDKKLEDSVLLQIKIDIETMYSKAKGYMAVIQNAPPEAESSFYFVKGNGVIMDVGPRMRPHNAVKMYNTISKFQILPTS